MWPFKPRKAPSGIAQRIADEFRRGEIVKRNLNGHGISEMAVRYRGALVRLSWFENPVRWPRSFSINDNASFPKGIDSQHIFDAAWKRADQLIDEDMRELSQR